MYVKMQIQVVVIAIWNEGAAKRLRSLLRLAADFYREQEWFLLRSSVLPGCFYIWSDQKMKQECTKEHYTAVSSKRSELQRIVPSKNIIDDSF